MRRWLDPFITAWTGIVSHKLRSFLTILGIVIGISAVITLLSAQKGTERDILDNIQTMGTNLVTISPGAFMFGGVRGGMSQTLTQQDAEDIWQQINNIEAISPSYSSGLQLVAGGNNTNASVVGTTPEYLTVNNLGIESGAFFSAADYNNKNKVAVLGASLVETLYGDTDPVGQQLRMGTMIVRVVGVLESKGFMFGSSDMNVYIPLSVMQQAVAQPRTAQGDRIVSSITLTVSDEKYTEQVIQDITSLLRNNHHLTASDDDDFNIMSTEEFTEVIMESRESLNNLFAASAIISLAIGGIGIMNIMLVSVLERTREIGIRKALGARQVSIWSQFLIEAVFLTFTGGIIGIPAGWGASIIVDNMDNMSTMLSADIVVLAVAVSVGIGLIFGFYPAWNASRLNPIEALRAE